MKVYLLGAGSGDPSLITVKAQTILRTADVIVYDALANTELLSLTKKDAERIYVGKIAEKHALPQAEINQLLIDKARENKIVARLKGGDPYIFGRGGEEAEALVQANIPFEEVPGISSTIAAPAYAGIPLTHRDLVSQVTLITGHENPEKETSALNWDALAAAKSTLVFVMGMKNLPRIVENLLKAGLSPSTPAALIYRGTTPSQRSIVTELGQLPIAAKEGNFTNPSIIVVGEVCALQTKLNWFEKQPLFGKTIVVTRAREQASVLPDKLTALGAKVIQCPTIAITQLKDPKELREAINRLEHYQWIIFTSQNGVRAFFTCLHNLSLDSRALHGAKICAIGPGTNKMLQAYGLHADLIPQRFVAESVVEDFLAANKENLDKLHVLIPRAAKARDVLPMELSKAGCHVDVVPCYETIQDASNIDVVREHLKSGSISCITFTSTSTVNNFLKLLPANLLKDSKTQLAAIGPITKEALEKAGLSCQIQPEEYTIDALVSALVAHADKLPG